MASSAPRNESWPGARSRPFGAVPGLRLRGIVDPNRMAERVPTFAFTLAGHSPREIATELGRLGIAVWDGDYYAYELIRTLGLAESGGIGPGRLVHYNTRREIDRLIRGPWQNRRQRAMNDR